MVQQFIQKYQIQALLISSRDYRPKVISRLYKIYFDTLPQSEMNQTLHTDPQKPYILQQVARQCSMFKAGPYSVIPAQAFYQPNCLKP
jgi:hypothetical protein